MTSIRQKEDPLNAISAGFLTGGVLALRAGPKAALLNAGIGGVLLGLIEGVSFLVGRFGEPASAAPAAVPGLGAGTQGGLFGGPTAPPRNNFANLQPRRSLTTALDDPTAQFLSLDDEDVSQFRSASATPAEGAQTDASIPSLFSNAAFGSAPPPVYAAAVEFSTDDFAFNDSDDFDDDQQ